jgi:TP901 family phage tail tape measure protein
VLNGLGLGIVLSARDMASSTLGRVERAYISLDRRVEEVTDDIDRSMRGFGGKTFAMAASIAGAFGAAKIIGAAGDFEEGMTMVGSLTSATTEQMRQLEDAAFKAGQTTQYSPLQAAAAMREFGSAGYDAASVIELLPPALDLAAASFGELTPDAAAGLATQTMKAFGIATTEARFTMDQLSKAANLFSMRNDDLPLAIGNITRGSSRMNQSLSESLIAFGLVKEIIPGTEKAATAASVAMERLGNAKTQKMFRGLKVDIFDGNKQFRNFLDIAVDLMAKLNAMNEKQRASFLEEAFGADGSQGIQNVVTQLSNGVKNNAGVIVKGAEAVAFLRSEFENAGGTVAATRDRMLNTFNGQKKLLLGNLQTLAIALGQPLAEALTPVLRAAVRIVNGMTEAVRNMPAPVKRAAAAVLVGVAAVGALVIGLNALRGGFALAVLGLRLVKAASLSALASLAPMALVVGAVAAVIAAFVVAYRKNLGGFADFIDNIGAKVRLVFDAIVQVFRDGAFSGAVMDELGKAENSGIKRFVISLYMVWHRLQRLWAGITEGFTAAIDVLRPVWQELVSAFQDIGAEAGGLVNDVTGVANALPSQQFLSFGQKVGKVLGWIVSAVVAVVGWHARLVAGFLAGFRAVEEFMAPAFSALKDAFGALIGAFKELFGWQDDTTIAAGEVGSVFRTVGEVLGKTFGAAVTGLTYILTGLAWVLKGIVDAIGWVKDLFIDAGVWIIETGSMIGAFFSDTFGPVISIALDLVGAHFKSMKDFVVMMIDAVKQAIESLIQWIKDAWESISGFFDAIGDGVGGAIDSVGDFLGDRASSVGDVFRSVGRPTATARTAGLVPEASAAVAEAAARGGSFTGLFDQMAAIAASQNKGQTSTVNVALQVDGETLARVTARAAQDAAHRAFVPVL